MMVSVPCELQPLHRGQQESVDIARALYFVAYVGGTGVRGTLALTLGHASVPRRTVDAHVGKALFHGAIMGLRARGKAIVFIKHALHFLPKADDMCPSRAARLRNPAHRTSRVDTLESGRVVKGGTYAVLAGAGDEFARLKMSRILTQFVAGLTSPGLVSVI
jgi:ATP-binding cassette subfamily C (CFTR/MRP) protein 1